GNAYVAAAKRLLFGKVGIDMIAGPSEVLIIADDTGNADWIAADLLAQAEHDTSAQAILMTEDETLAGAVERAVEGQLARLRREKIAAASWRDSGAVILPRSREEGMPLVDLPPPEHWKARAADPDALVKRIR